MDKNKKPELKLIKTEQQPIEIDGGERPSSAGEMLAENVKKLRACAIASIEAYAIGEGEAYERVAQALGWAPNLGTLEELVEIVNELEKRKGIQ